MLYYTIIIHFKSYKLCYKIRISLKETKINFTTLKKQKLIFEQTN